MAKAEETVLEIDLNALTHNFEYLKSKLKKNTKFLAVVKAFAYGSDAEQVALHLQQLNVDYFAVAYTSEGVALRNAGITKPILVLHPQPINFKAIIDHCLEPSLYSARVLKSFISCAEKENQSSYPVHIKFNTGLNRLGFWENDVDYIVSQLKNNSSIKIVSVFSHLAASEDLSEKEFTKSQISSFKNTSKKLIDSLNYKPILHLCNTSGVLNYPKAHLDMVRCGIGLCGFGNSASENKNLKPIATLKSVISQIHLIEKGESVGYNRAFKSTAFKKTATIPIGHADGVGRHFGNGKGFVFINKEKANIIGNVCMDMIMVDITHIDCNEGDEVIIFDNQHTAENLAESANTISYELITSISRRIKRKIIK
ncbi:alanine racemase [Flavobacteriaceae bacterium S0825]|uniref:alanine racemase n=1 Tax=Gaetbulibacter sp. S0825 TaxID=2720084 RepID=UPI00142F8EE5|nr:alanine racemase [Gaetbulibacter sp. S0825]MCK0108200.1 alanine racemase [Flavobacteriaceae bacterium S0825]NIX63836.1 alanine racemase [Gaetbulibacter sp. S0825]